MQRHAGGGFPLLSPAEATIVDSGPWGLGIETASHLAVGGLTSVDVFLPAGEVSLLGRVRWARLVESRRCGEGEYEPVFRAGLSLVETPSLAIWNDLRARLISPQTGRGAAPAPASQRRVVRWRQRRA